MILHRLLAVQVGIDDSLVKQKAFGTEDIFEMYVAPSPRPRIHS